MAPDSLDADDPNSTIPWYNIMEMNCFVDNFDKVACIRCGILTGLALLTMLLCIGKLIKLHVARHPSCHQYGIFYAAALECLIGGIQWTLWNASELDYLLHYIKLLQVLLMCHYYITLAVRAVRKEYWGDKFMYPFLFIGVVYFTMVTTFGIFYTQSSHLECFAPYRLALSSAELVLVQVFFVCGFYITRRLNEISTLDSVRWAQKRDLWCIVIVFELSALSTFVFDLFVRITGDVNTGCSAVFSYHQMIYSPLLVTLMVLKLLLPIWVMMMVFQPATVTPAKDGETVMPGYSDDGTYGSIFSEDLAYRQLYQPGESFPYAVNSATGSPIMTGSCMPCGPCIMYDAAMPFTYTNPTLPHSSSLQPIIEEACNTSSVLDQPTSSTSTACKPSSSALEDEKKKKSKKARKGNSKDPSTPKKKTKAKKSATKEINKEVKPADV